MKILLSDDYFTDNLIYLRKKYALSRRALARLIGTTEALLKGIEDKTFYPELPIEAYQRLCEVFHIESNDLATKDLTSEP